MTGLPTHTLSEHHQPADAITPSVPDEQAAGVACTGKHAHPSLIATAIEPDAARVSRRFREGIDRDFARLHLIVSQGSDDDAREQLCVSEMTDPAAVFNVGVRLGCPVEPVVASAEAIAAVLDQAYAQPGDNGSAAGGADATDAITNADSGSDADDRLHDIDRLLATADRDLLTTQGKGPVIKLVDALLFDALRRLASDVHVQPLEDRGLIRFRLDGVLHTMREIPPTLIGPIISRIKVMGRMDIAEKRIAQDGRATVTIGAASRRIDLRISTLPTQYGERAVVRLLDHAHQLCDFARLQMPQRLAERYLHSAQRTSGIILITGPTGSGKTTTLYATLNEIGSPVMNIMTIEDPIEYDLSSVGLPVSQAQVNLKKGISFASGLRHILRQDPDVVMVGEIRDAETARIAIQASLTGHLVLSTLHTNDAPSAISRLVDLGVEPYLVSASLTAVLAQRLVRTIHQDCGGSGCPVCFGTGLMGRRGLFELMVVEESIRSMIAQRADLSAIRAQARAAGMETLYEQGRRMVEQGVTSELEVQRVTQEVL